MKYASYCSTLSKGDIRQIFQDYLNHLSPGQSAAETISAFLDEVDYDDLVLNKGVSQRIILVAANFRKEVTSTVLWLNNFRVRIQCFRATPYVMGEELFLNIEQIIPTKDTEDFTIGLADKAKDEIAGIENEARRHPIRRQFWSDVIKAMNASPSSLYQNISPSKESWISAASGLRGLGLNFAATKDYCRAELYIDRGDKAENEAVFDLLLAQKDNIEAEFGSSLTWERLDAKRACRIKSQRDGNIFDREVWPDMIDFMVKSMIRLEGVLKPKLQHIKAKLS